MAFDTAIAAMTIYCEDSSGTHEERVLVAWTIFNRLRARRFAKTVAGVCLKRAQFSEWDGDKVNNANLMRAAEVSDDDPVMRDCVAAFNEAAAASVDPTEGATHYYDKSRDSDPPTWSLPPAVLSFTTDNFRFFRNVA